MTDRQKLVNELHEHLRAAMGIYQQLMVSSPTDQERMDWAIDADDVERAKGFAASFEFRDETS